jgi:hypothetical protein
MACAVIEGWKWQQEQRWKPPPQPCSALNGRCPDRAGWWAKSPWTARWYTFSDSSNPPGMRDQQRKRATERIAIRRTVLA